MDFGCPPNPPSLSLENVQTQAQKCRYKFRLWSTPTPVSQNHSWEKFGMEYTGSQLDLDCFPSHLIYFLLFFNVCCPVGMKHHKNEYAFYSDIGICFNVLLLNKMLKFFVPQNYLSLKHSQINLKVSLLPAM